MIKSSASIIIGLLSIIISLVSGLFKNVFASGGIGIPEASMKGFPVAYVNTDWNTFCSNVFTCIYPINSRFNYLAFVINTTIIFAVILFLYILLKKLLIKSNLH